MHGDEDMAKNNGRLSPDKVQTKGKSSGSGSTAARAKSAAASTAKGGKPVKKPTATRATRPAVRAVVKKTAAKASPVRVAKPVRKSAGNPAKAARNVASAKPGTTSGAKKASGVKKTSTVTKPTTVSKINKRAPVAPKAAAVHKPGKVGAAKAAARKPAATPVRGKATAARPSAAKNQRKLAVARHGKSAGSHAPAATQHGGHRKTSAGAAHVSAHPTHAPVIPVRKAAVTNAPGSPSFKGRIASATAMVTTRQPKAAAPVVSHKHSKNSSDSMNKSAVTNLDNGVTREDGRYALPATSTIELPRGYVPGAKEEYMNPRQLAYFRNKLRSWRAQLVEESRQTMDNLREEVRDVGDEAERATRETENSLELRTRDRYRKLIAKIDKALRRIEDGTYGFCEETDEEIGIERLDARPIATLSLDAQERREHLQKQMGD
jgi:DnaK suppressor protein